jgi:anti-sigma factor RsiW
MTTCQDLDVLVTLRATGDLSPDEARRLELHLAACARCRAEADADAALLRQVALPPPSDAERRATAGLARATLADLQRRERRTGWWRRAVVGLAAAAAISFAVLAPALLGRRAHVPPGAVATSETAAAASASGWEPDLDTVWNDTAILDEDAGTSSEGATDAAVASLDY